MNQAHAAGEGVVFNLVLPHPPREDDPLMPRLIWEDKNGDIDIDEEMMQGWFAMAIANLHHYDISDEESAWMLFLMGAETAIRGNRGDSPYETESWGDS